MRIVYPVLWSRLGRQASWEQAANTIAALGRAGHDVTVLMPQAPADPPLDARAVCEYFGIEGDFRLIQRPSRHAGERLGPSLMWLRQVFADPELRGADLLYSRIPAMLGMGQFCPIPFATDHYRLWPDELPMIRWSFRRTARHRRCLGVILHSAYAADSYRRAGLPEDKLLVAHNGVPALAPIAKDEARSALGLPQEQAIAVYAGRINMAKGLDQVLAMAALRPDVLFVLVGSEGDGPIERSAAGLANVRIFPWAEPGALAPWLAAADVLIIPPSRAPLDRHGTVVLPMKLFAYLAAGRPILAPVAPDTAELLVDGENALLVAPDTPELAAAALDRLLREPDLGDRLAANNLCRVADLTWDRRAQKVAAFLDSRLAAQRSA